MTEPIATITTKRVRKFYWMKLIFHFARLVAEFCSQLGIKHSITLVDHPQTNEQAESANKEKARRGQGTIGKRVIASIIVVSYNITLNHIGNPIPTNIWCGRDDPGGNRGTISMRSLISIFSKRERDESKFRFVIKAYVKEYAAKVSATRKYNAKVFPKMFRKRDLDLKRVLKDL
ncbi:hypothetical protein CR513_49984, partial [Mucuna pruriens]